MIMNEIRSGDFKGFKAADQIKRVEKAQTAPEVARVVNSELPVGMDGEAFLRGLSKHAELKERPWILDEAWGKRGR